MQPDGGVLFVHAHPDDESMSTGGTMARLVAEGIRVDLVTCTDGAEGEIHDPTLDPEEARPRLAQIRAEELACSIEALGGGSIHHHLLGYRDSGMMGTDANEHPDSFWKTDLARATARLVEIVRAARPATIVSYDENGNYGHPDHINAARIARDAYRASAGTDWEVSRFYEIAWLRDRWFALMSAMKERGISLPWDVDESMPQTPADELNPSNAAAAQQVGEALESNEGDAFEFGRPDEEVTTRVDVSGFLEQKRRSMDCHKTQRQDLGWLLDLPEDLADGAIDLESYVLRWRDQQDVPSTLRETWLLG
ncbi:MAG TPA: PIG-L family deacetylase [Candidatus Limnocylindria bacterium]|nr:PIG-L family deacetylase [Candidatus Limnocylindria bacterium]